MFPEDPEEQENVDLALREAGVVKRQAARDIAAEEWIATGNDKQQALRNTRKRLRQDFGSVWAIILINVAVKVILWWIDKKINKPATVGFQTGEPYA